MKSGNWVPISKAFSVFLPKGRPFTRLEAAYSLQLDYDAGNHVTLSGYAALWGWGKGTVIRFLDEMGVKIVYPESTANKQNQSGLIIILIPDRKRTESGLIRLINSRCIDEPSDRKRTESGLKTDRSRYATIDPNPDPKENIPVSAIVRHLNNRSGKAFKANSKKTISLIKARFNDGFSLDDFLHVINQKAATWANDPKMSAYLRPETLFGPKFEAYLNENGAAPKPAPSAPKGFEL